MTHSRSSPPHRPWPVASESSVGPSMMGDRVMALFLRPTTPPLWLGIVVAISLIGVETLLVYGLNQIAPENAFGALFLLGVLVVSAGWGFGLAVMTTLASALVYVYFHLGTDGASSRPARKTWWRSSSSCRSPFLPTCLLVRRDYGQPRQSNAAGRPISPLSWPASYCAPAVCALRWMVQPNALHWRWGCHSRRWRWTPSRQTSAGPLSRCWTMRHRWARCWSRPSCPSRCISVCASRWCHPW